MGSLSWSWILWYFCTAEMSSVSIHQEFLRVSLCGLAVYLHVTTSIILYCYWCLCCFWQPWVLWRNNLDVTLCILYIFSFVQCSTFTEKKVLTKDNYCILFSLSSQVATDKVAGKLSSTLSWVKNTVSHTVSQMASQVASPSASLHTTSSSTTLSTPALSPSSPTQLSPDDLELLAKLEEQNRWVENFLVFKV